MKPLENTDYLPEKATCKEFLQAEILPSYCVSPRIVFIFLGNYIPVDSVINKI